MNILKAVNLRKIYGQGETEVRALDGINLEVEKGEFVAIVGTSGSGKSTLLHIIGGLDNPTSGQVIVDGQNLSHMPDEELTIFRRRNIGFVFQQYNLVPMLNVKECIFNCNKRFKNLWLQFFLSQNQGFMRLFEKTVLK